MIIIKGKSPPIVWDGSTKKEPNDIVMNDISPLEQDVVFASRSIAKNIYPDISEKELSKFLAHMICVTATVLLQAAGKPGLLIQTRLLWESDAYKVFQATDILAHQHNKSAALTNACVGAYNVSAANMAPATNAPRQLTPDESGTYSDI